MRCGERHTENTQEKIIAISYQQSEIHIKLHYYAKDVPVADTNVSLVFSA